MVIIKSKKEIEIMAEGGKILAKIMKELEKRTKPGITTKELDRLAESLILKSGGKCSFKGYKDSDGYSAIPFPACLCTSINEEIVHVAPSDRILKKGDIISLDIGMKYKGFHTDMAITLLATQPGNVEKIDPGVLRLIRVTKKALKRGIKKAKAGNTFGDIGNTIERYVQGQGFNVVRDLCGHGIGKELHQEPQILNYGKRKTGPEIKEGMVFCLEPMVTMGDWHIKRLAPYRAEGSGAGTKNGFGYETQDGSLSAHFEQTIAITKTGPKILTPY